MTLSEFLREALALIEDRKCWTKGAFARDAAGGLVGSSAATAVQFCSIGACARVRSLAGLSSGYSARAAKALSEAAGLSDEWASFARAQDAPMTKGGLGHKGVVRAFRKAIETAEQEEAANREAVAA